jgi:transcription antitermination protein NusB
MARRTRAREVALQLLFQHDLNQHAIPRAVIEQFTHDRIKNDELTDYALKLYDGVLANQKVIDETIGKIAENWRLSRMMPADRNTLRIGCYELLHEPNALPHAVVINEGIELAHRFGTADSPGFVNGILDKIAKLKSPTPDAEAPSAAKE